MTNIELGGEIDPGGGGRSCKESAYGIFETVLSGVKT